MSGTSVSKSMRQKRPARSRPLGSPRKRSRARRRCSPVSGKLGSVARESRSCEASAAATATLGKSLGLFAELVVAFALDAICEIRVAGLDDASVDHDVHDVGDHVLQNSCVQGDVEEYG